MTSSYKRWQKLFLFCLGLTVGTAFCMKWMEGDFWQNGEKFTIIGLEIGYPKEKLMHVLSGLDNHVKTILGYNLCFDFAFMAGVYPGITSLCMMARDKAINRVLKNIFFILGMLQLVAWGCDIFENSCLLKWIKDPVIGAEFGIYHIIVACKWVIALTGAALAIPFSLRRRRKNIEQMNKE